MEAGCSPELIALVTELLDYGEKGITQVEHTPEYPDVFSYAIAILTTESIEEKCRLTFDAYNFYHTKVIPMGDHHTTPLPPLIPARPPLNFMKPADVGTLKQKASKVDPIEGLMRIAHSQAHIESYAIDLSWDILVRFCHPQPPCYANPTDIVKGSELDYTELLSPYFYKQLPSGETQTLFLKAGAKETFLLGPEHDHIPVPPVSMTPKVEINIDETTLHTYTVTHKVHYDIGPNIRDTKTISFCSDDAFAAMAASKELTTKAKETGDGTITNEIAYIPPNTHLPPYQVLPEQFFVLWLQVAQDEARHYLAWQKKLLEYQHYYGIFPVHDALWGSCVQSRDDLIHRLSLVHLIHEAFGLDCASRLGNQIRNSKDTDALRIFGIIQRDEVTHVKAGIESLDMIAHASNLASIPLFHLYARTTHPPRPPFNAAERAKAGMDPIWYLPLVINKKKPASETPSPPTGDEAAQEQPGKRLNIREIMAQRKQKQVDEKQQQPVNEEATETTTTTVAPQESVDN